MKALIKLLAAILFSTLLQPYNTNAQCHIDDWTALKALYQSTNGDNWIANDGWGEVLGSTPTNNCNIEDLIGVTTHENGRVKYLLLLVNNLTGSLPQELGNLSELTWLNLEYNSLTGNIPSELGNLLNLEKLELSVNQLSGSIPPELGNLLNLERFTISVNNLSGCFPDQIIPFCTRLDSNSSIGNSFDATWEDFCTSGSGTCIPNCHSNDWTALKALYESTGGDSWINNDGWQEITGMGPSSDCNLGNLYGISLSETGRVNCIDLDGNLDCDITDAGNNLFGTIPSDISRLSELTFLNLNSNQLSGHIPSELGNLTKLTVLSLFDNQLSGTIPLELGNLTKLTYLSLSFNQLSGTIPIELSNLVDLTVLFLADNQLSGTIPHEIGNLINLSHLSLRDNNLTGNIPSVLGNLSNLIKLWLFGNELNGSMPHQLGNLNNLTFLKINDNNLSGCYPINISKFCSQLTSSSFVGNVDISQGNNFDASWEDFCDVGVGTCILYPGDLNHDGIVNNQDVGLWGLFLYETGPPRATEHQNTDWVSYPAEDWNRLQINNEDIKHFDTNGDGVIQENDCQAVTANFGQTWSSATTVEMPDAPEESDYQVMLQPIGQIVNGFLILNVSLERRAGGNLDIRGGHFTIDYSHIEENVNYANLVLYDESWLGESGEDLFYEIRDLPDDKKIEIGFTKNNVNSTGRGIIGDLIISFQSNSKRSMKTSTMHEVRVTGIGVQNGTNYTQIENEVCLVNMNEDNCQTDWYISENTPFQNIYEGEDLIETQGFLIIGDEQEIEYRANRVCMQAGFEVKAGANFKAGYGSCN